jgi:tetratricopeptide (TPR) repeat protein
VTRKFIYASFLLLLSVPVLTLNAFAQPEGDQKSASVSNVKKAENYFKQAVSKYNNNDLQGAVRDYTTAIRLNPNYVDAYFNRALIRDILKDYEGSMSDYNKAVELSSKKNNSDEIMDIINTHMDLGNIKAFNYDYDGAIDEYSKVINMQPLYAQAYIGRAEVKFVTEDYNGALADFDKAIQINPNVSAEIYYKTGNIKYILKMYEDSIKNYTEAIKRLPNYQDAYYQLIGSCILSGDFPSALEYIKKYISIVKDPYIYAKDFQEWNQFLNKYKEDDVISDIRKYLKKFKVSA